MYENRLEKVIDYMKQDGLSQILVTGESDIKYLTGIAPFSLERVAAFLIKDTGDVSLFVNNVIAFPKDDEHYSYHMHTDNDDPYAQIADALEPGTLGVDRTWMAGHLIALMQKRPDIKFVNGSMPLRQARLRKEPDEIIKLRAASDLNDRVMSHVAEALAENPNMSEKDLSNEADRFFMENGAEKNPWFQVVCFRYHAAKPHHVPKAGFMVEEGDAVLLDLYAEYDNYWCDMSRTYFYKSVSDRDKELYEIVKRAQQAAIDMAKPGNTFGQVHKAAVDVIHDAGYDYDGRIGHGIGVDPHEYPDVSQNDIVIEENMVFTLEPGLYIPHDIGIRIEDTVLAAGSGCAPLNKLSKELTIIR